MIRQDIEKVIKRTNEFEESKKGMLVQIKGISEFAPERRPLNSFGLPDNMETYLDYRIEQFMSYWEKRALVEDDLFPCINPWYGIAEHTAFVGGEVDFSEQTSWHHKVMETYEDFNKVSLDENNQYLKLVIDGMKYLNEKADGRFFTKFRGADGPMDIANILRGNDLFYDFYEEEENLKKLMDFCADAVIFTMDKQLKEISKIGGGVVTGFDIWLKGHSIGHISEDASTMISKDHYEEFGKPFTSKITEKYDHVFMHVHSLGAHILPSIAGIKNIDHIEISNDPNCKRAIDVYKEYEECFENKVGIVLLTKEELLDNISFLKDRKTILWYEADTKEEADEIIDIVRNIDF